jgi:molybdate-binding protein
VLDQGRPRLLPGSDLDALVVVGCDPALGLLASMLPAHGPRRLIALSGSTAAALEAMRSGRAHAALVHDRVGRLPGPPAGALRVHVARWRVGIASRGPKPRSVKDLCHRGARVVQREAGASSQKALVAAVSAEGAGPLAGPTAPGHLEVARRVAAGAVAGVTMEPAALQHELAFWALEEHVAELWVDGRWRAHAGAEATVEALRSAAFTARLELVGGYDVAGCGDLRGAGG